MIGKEHVLQKVRDPKMFNNMMALICEYKLDLDVLFKSAKTSNLFIGGSSVLQAILGERWKFSDLDIYMMDGCSHADAVIEMIKEKGYEFDKFWPFVYKNSRTFHFHKDGKNIDIVLIDTPFDDFFNAFDFDVCQTRFDGQEFVVLSLQNVLDKTITINFNDKKALPKVLEERIDKYRYRGFTFDGKTERRIEALVNLRHSGFGCGLAMGGETEDYMEDNYLVGLDPREERKLSKEVDVRMMKRWGRLTID